MSKENGGAQRRGRLFQDTVARPLGGQWLLMNKQAGGFRSYAMAYPSLAALALAWSVSFGDCADDEHGPFVEVRRA